MTTNIVSYGGYPASEACYPKRSGLHWPFWNFLSILKVFHNKELEPVTYMWKPEVAVWLPHVLVCALCVVISGALPSYVVCKLNAGTDKGGSHILFLSYIELLQICSCFHEAWSFLKLVLCTFLSLKKILLFGSWDSNREIFFFLGPRIPTESHWPGSAIERKIHMREYRKSEISLATIFMYVAWIALRSSQIQK